MSLFEVFIPGKESGMPNVTLTVEAQNWIGALRSGLKSIGEGQESIANVMCDIKDDNSIHVTDVATRRVFRLREVGAKPAEPAPASAAPASQAFDAKSDPQTIPEGPRPISMDNFALPDTIAVSDSTVDPDETTKNVRPSDFDTAQPRTLVEFPAPNLKVALPTAESSVAWTKMPGPVPPKPVVTEPDRPNALAAAAAPPAPSAAAPAGTAPWAPAPAAAPAVPGPAVPGPTVPAAAVPAPAVPAPAVPVAAAATETAPWAPAPAATSSPFSSRTPSQSALAPLGPAPTPSAAAIAAAPVSGVAAATRPVTAPATEKLVEQTERVARSPSKPSTGPTTVPPTPRGVPAPLPRRPSGQFSSAAEPKSREVSAAQPTDPRIGRVELVKAPAAAKGAPPPIDVQDAIAAVFDATQDLYMEAALSPQHVADKLLDIALKHIPAEAGTFYIADVNGHELVFAAVRGPKADALKKSGVTVKVGQGIIGFCAQEGVCLAVSDIQKDPRFLASIAKSIDYQPKDTLCASAEKDGRLWGAVQIINSRGGFEAAHMEVLRFIGLTAAAMLERIDDRA